MSNENLKSPIADKPADKLTRIPVRQIFWNTAQTNMDHAGSSQTSNTKMFAEPANVPSKWKAVFLPAWQHIELTYIAGQGASPVVEMIPIHKVLRWIAE
jgi:hypothetical protein